MISRRKILYAGAAIGCSLAASPLLTPISFAAVPGENRLVVILLRGAMDGLDLVRPLGDPAYARLRPKLSAGADPLPLDGFFALHPALGGLYPLWAKGELGFVHAVSTPYRDKRSHFDGQDLLEAGIMPGATIRDGWLNRLVDQLPSASLQTAFAVGDEEMLILSGKAAVSRWTPQSALGLGPRSRQLLGGLYENAPAFGAAMEQAAAMSADIGGSPMAASLSGAPGIEGIAAFAADRLLAETRIAAFSISGWDTHSKQANALPRALRELESAVLTLRHGLGPVWGQTLVMAMTEFGRTARENGSGGTDHGTGGAMVLAGGALNGGKVLGKWPGLDEASLFERRDLMPTADLRAYAACAIEALFATSRAVLERKVFPGLDTAGIPGFVR